MRSRGTAAIGPICFRTSSLPQPRPAPAPAPWSAQRGLAAAALPRSGNLLPHQLTASTLTPTFTGPVVPRSEICPSSAPARPGGGARGVRQGRAGCVRGMLGIEADQGDSMDSGSAVLSRATSIRSEAACARLEVPRSLLNRTRWASKERTAFNIVPHSTRQS
ncbi:hypothetical protein NDU88_000626 [Pleurodeles waltl]|uniref:Uncharacterized protein n=1 Tax=Pleurodeles waltl TaxID=8319 RepID=A0AAV7M0R2_PLEWA|nr:hypothetical protein NDU88_000626 [Pleurodeles waltl]